MITILPETQGNVVAIRASGRLTHDDYKAFVPQLEAIMDKSGSIRMLVDMEEFEGWEIHAAWDDFVLGLKHMGDFDRLALVGDKDWQKLAARITDALTGCTARSFTGRQWDEAWAWIKGE